MHAVLTDLVSRQPLGVLRSGLQQYQYKLLHVFHGLYGLICAANFRVHTRAASKPLGVLSLSLQNCPEAAVAPDTLSSSAPDAGATASTTAAPVSCFGAAVKEAMASLVPACVALPLTVDMVRRANSVSLWHKMLCLLSSKTCT